MTFLIEGRFTRNASEHNSRSILGKRRQTQQRGRGTVNWDNFDGQWWALSMPWLIENWLGMQKGYVLLRELFFPLVVMKSALLQMLFPSHTKPSLIYNLPHCFKSAAQTSCFLTCPASNRESQVGYRSKCFLSWGLRARHAGAKTLPQQTLDVVNVSKCHCRLMDASSAVHFFHYWL